MGLIVDYGSLQTAVTEWLWRTGDTQVQGRAIDFITNFESKFKRTQRLKKMETLASPTITAAAVPVPSDYLEAVRVQVLGNGVPNQRLDYVTPSRAAELDISAAVSGSGTGIARYYTILAEQIVITPQAWAPIGATLELFYYSFTPLASAQGGVNWLLAANPDIYLYGALMQGAAYIDDKETVGEWKAALDEALAELELADKRSRQAAGPLVMRASTSFVR